MSTRTKVVAVALAATSTISVTAATAAVTSVRDGASGTLSQVSRVMPKSVATAYWTTIGNALADPDVRAVVRALGSDAVAEGLAPRAGRVLVIPRPKWVPSVVLRNATSAGALAGAYQRGLVGMLTERATPLARTQRNRMSALVARRGSLRLATAFASVAAYRVLEGNLRHLMEHGLARSELVRPGRVNLALLPALLPDMGTLIDYGLLACPDSIEDCLVEQIIQALQQDINTAFTIINGESGAVLRDGSSSPRAVCKASADITNIPDSNYTNSTLVVDSATQCNTPRFNDSTADLYWDSNTNWGPPPTPNSYESSGVDCNNSAYCSWSVSDHIGVPDNAYQGAGEYYLASVTPTHATSYTQVYYTPI